ncbi:uncharacterized protein AB9X84_025277 [Acanthopagrus schlegelii]
MMKCVLALAVLLHFCSSFTLNRDLNREIIHDLDRLRKLYSHNKVTLTSPDRTGPALYSRNRKNASSCVHKFVRKLVHLLNNVTVDDDNKTIIDGLKLNLEKMDPGPNGTNQQVSEVVCRMNNSTTAPFNLYHTFFMQLNKSKKR